MFQYAVLGGYLVVDVGLIALLMVVTHFVGERHYEASTGVPYECGEQPTGSARLRFPVDFYLVAVFFVIFDVAAVFLFAWAVAARPLRWTGYFGILVLSGVLASGLAYLWRSGAFDWGKRRLEAHLERHGVDRAALR